MTQVTFYAANKDDIPAGHAFDSHVLNNVTSGKSYTLYTWYKPYADSASRYSLSANFKGLVIMACMGEYSYIINDVMYYYVDAYLTGISNPLLRSSELFIILQTERLGTWYLSRKDDQIATWDITDANDRPSAYASMVAVHDPKCGAVCSQPFTRLVNFPQIDRQHGLDPISIALRLKKVEYENKLLTSANKAAKTELLGMIVKVADEHEKYEKLIGSLRGLLFFDGPKN